MRMRSSFGSANNYFNLWFLIILRPSDREFLTWANFLCANFCVPTFVVPCTPPPPLRVLALTGTKLRAMAHQRADLLRAMDNAGGLPGWPDCAVPAGTGIGLH